MGVRELAEDQDPAGLDHVRASRELGELLEESDQLRSAIERETDGAVRAELRSQLRHTRKEIERRRQELGEDRRVPPTPDTVHSQVVGAQAGNQETHSVAGPGPNRRRENMTLGNGADRQWSTLTVVLATLVGALLVALAVTAVPLYRLLNDSDEAGPEETIEAGAVLGSDPADEETAIRAALEELGIQTVTVERRSTGIYIAGTVDSPEQRQVVLGIAQALAGGGILNATGITVANGDVEPVAADGGRAATLQAELNRTMAGTPLIFESGQTDLTELQRLVLNTIATSLKSFSDVPVNIVGHTDGTGTDEVNRQVSLVRAEAVRSYLVSQGVPEENLEIEARGESTSSGSGDLAGLERRVEFEVRGVAGGATVGADVLRIGIVAPSASNDAAFTESLIDSIAVIGTEREIEVAVTDRTFEPDLAAEAVRGYAADGYDLVIAHGSEYGASLRSIAEEFPNVTFAWGTATDTFGLPNLYAYDASAEEGGYVMGAISAIVSESGVVGVVGPIEVGSAERYVNGFSAGVLAEDPTAEVLVTYTNSFSDTALAAQVANDHVSAGADVLTGTAEMVVGAVSVATQNGIPWFGTQADQTSLDPELVAASQVYHWEVVLREVLADIDRGQVNGRGLELTLENQGLVIQYNDGYLLPPEAVQRAAQLTTEISEGRIDP